jgi:ATP-dependent exoDNAse (exonuclease V) alpha subunit
MLAARRTDVDELNLRARAHMHAAGLLTGPSLTVPTGPYAERTFTAGDIVTARCNDYRPGLINGQRGVVTAVDPDRSTLTARVAGREVGVEAGYLRDGGLDHGYALTVHQAQG